MRSFLLVVAALFLIGVGVFLVGGRPAVNETTTASPIAPSAPLGEPHVESLGESLVDVGTSAARSTSEAAAATKSTTESAAPAETQLIVRVVDRGGTPIVGALVTCNGLLSQSAAARPPTRGGLQRTLRTDEAGTCTVEVPPRTSIHVDVAPGETYFRRTQAEHAGVAAGDVVELKVTVHVPDGWFYGVVRAAEDGSPLSGVSIHAKRHAGGVRHDGDPVPLWNTGAATVTTDTEGCFRLPLANWEGGLVLASSDERSPVLVEIDPSFEHAADPMPVRLQLAARLVGRIDGADGMGSAVTVQLTCPAYQLGKPPTPAVFGSPDPLWSAAVGRDGRFEVTGLPPETQLKLIVDHEGEVVFRPPNPLSFAPGETRHVQWRIGGGSTLRVFAVNGEGTPQPDLKLALFASSEVFGDWIQSRFKSVRLGRTDADGRLTWDDVPPGDWAIGPASGQGASERDRGLDRPAPVVERVTIAPDSSDVDILLTIHRGIMIRGSVIGPAGEVVPHAFLRARRLGSSPLFLSENIGRGGAFVLGPLPPGRYALVCSTFSEPHWCESDSVVVEAGAENVEIRLKAGGSLRLRLVDAATGERSSGFVWIDTVEGGALRGESVDKSRDTVLGGLAEGTYQLTGVSESGSIGTLRNLEIRAADELGPLEVLLEPAGRVRVHYEGPAQVANYSIRQDGGIFGFDGILNGTSTSRAAPIGTVEVILTVPVGGTDAEGLPVKAEHSRTVTVRKGVETDVEFKLED